MREVELYETRSDNRVLWGIIVNEVSKSYANVCLLPSLTAIVYDPDGTPNRACGADAIHFKVDVESVVNEKIGNEDELFKSWQKLVEGDSPSSKEMLRLAVRLGPEFSRRGLRPLRYFRTIKKGRPDRRPVIGVS
jgi:hypothetical protein